MNNDLEQAPSEEIPVVAQVTRTTDPKQGFLARVREYDNFWGILLVNFGVTGVLGLPLIWCSNKFSKPQKIVWSVIVTAYTMFLFSLCAMVCMWAYRAITNH